MSTLLAHIKIVEGHEEKFENISKEVEIISSNLTEVKRSFENKKRLFL